jgi:hypothetical protein
MGRYVSQPLTVQCSSVGDIQKSLSGCKYVSDERQFGRKDYWQAPEVFEQTKKGDCDCFAIWTWRQFLALGFDARFVAGRSGRYGEGHAWVQFTNDQGTFLVDPTAARVGATLPRLSTLGYEPKFSVGWDGKTISFYSHKKPNRKPPLWKLIALIPDWLIFWSWIWIRMAIKVVTILVLSPVLLLRRIRRHHKSA